MATCRGAAGKVMRTVTGLRCSGSSSAPPSQPRLRPLQAVSLQPPFIAATPSPASLGADFLLLSHSAAAHSQKQNHTSAVSDARKALEIDPKFSKAYSRLGHALFSSGEYAQAVEAYEKGLEIDPTVRYVLYYMSKAQS